MPKTRPTKRGKDRRPISKSTQRTSQDEVKSRKEPTPSIYQLAAELEQLRRSWQHANSNGLTVYATVFEKSFSSIAMYLQKLANEKKETITIRSISAPNETPILTGDKFNIEFDDDDFYHQPLPIAHVQKVHVQGDKKDEEKDDEEMRALAEWSKRPMCRDNWCQTEMEYHEKVQKSDAANIPDYILERPTFGSESHCDDQEERMVADVEIAECCDTDDDSVELFSEDESIEKEKQRLLVSNGVESMFIDDKEKEVVFIDDKDVRNIDYKDVGIKMNNDEADGIRRHMRGEGDVDVVRVDGEAVAVAGAGVDIGDGVEIVRVDGEVFVDTCGNKDEVEIRDRVEIVRVDGEASADTDEVDIEDGGKGIWKGKLNSKRKMNGKAHMETTEPKDEKGVCPDCGKMYGKKLWRHLRNVEHWPEARIKETFCKQGTPSGNPLRPCPFERCTALIKNYIAHWKSRHNLDKKENPIMYRKMLEKMNGRIKQPTSDGTAATFADSISNVENYKNEDEDDEDKGDKVEDESDSETEEIEYPTRSRSAVTLYLETSSNFAVALKAFLDFLESPDGGGKERKDAFQRTQQVHTIAFEICDSTEINNVLSLPWMDHNKVWSFFKDHLNKYKAFEEAEKGHKIGMERGLKPGSLKSYSLALATYLDFLVNTHNPALPDEKALSEQQQKQLLALLKKQDNWRTTIQKHVIRRVNVMRANELSGIITISDMRQIIDSKFALSCRAHMKALHARHIMNNKTRCDPKDAVNFRNFLVLQLSAVNGGRPSLMDGLTVGQVQKARLLANGMWSVPVAHHKTSNAYGPAFLQWNNSIDFIVKAYINCVRPVLTGEKVNTVAFLVNNTGTKGLSSQFHRWLDSFAKLCGYTAKKVSNTNIRKMIVTGLHPDSTREEKDNLAKKMKHAPRTADQYYNTSSEEVMSSEVTKQLMSLMQKTNEDDEKESEKDKDWLPTDEEDEEDEDSNEEPEEKPQLQSLQGGGTNGRKGKFVWKKEDVRTLERAFKKILNDKNQWPKRKDVLKIFMKDEESKEIWKRNDSDAHRERCLYKIKNMYQARHCPRKNNK